MAVSRARKKEDLYWTATFLYASVTAKTETVRLAADSCSQLLAGVSAFFR